jgi:hypothetical protein
MANKVSIRAYITKQKISQTLEKTFFCITGKPQYNKSKETKDFVLYSRNFVIAEGFYYRINYRGAGN